MPQETLKPHPMLKPCPFCGNEYPFLYSPDKGYHWVASCEHGDCMIRTLPEETQISAMARWNRRSNEKGRVDKEID